MSDVFISFSCTFCGTCTTVVAPSGASDWAVSGVIVAEGEKGTLSQPSTPTHHPRSWRRRRLSLTLSPTPNGTLKTYKDFPHGMPTTQADTINADLLEFIEQGQQSSKKAA